jgi:alpha-L-fucosidase
MTACLRRICLTILPFACLPAAAQETKPPESPAPAPHLARLEWWREARFGMFIHWGPVSLKGTEIGWSRGSQIPIEEYDGLYKRFDPVLFDADEWVKVAKAAGMKYMVFTTKHHDGFCMWDTKQTDFNIMGSPFGRDVVKELSDACRKGGIAFGTYHSVCDWHHPDFPLGSPGGKTRKPSPNLERYTTYLRNQVTELITKYGPLIVMWFDVPQEFDAKRGQALIDLARSLQPDIIVNNRSGAAGDYDTPEQRVGKFQMGRPWETCMTICRQWAWKPNDEMKSLRQCLQTLVTCAGGDGNLLFNVGPMPDGRIEPRQVERLREMGTWLAKYGEAVYGTRGGPFKPTRSFASTRRGSTVFVHVFGWGSGPLALPALPKRIVASSLLTGGKVEVKETAGGLTIDVPPADRQEIDTIVKLELDGPAMDIPPLAIPSSIKATASNVFQHMVDEHGPECAFDGDPSTRWATDTGTGKAWIALDLGKPKAIRGVRIREAYAGRVRKFEFQYRVDAGWTTIFAGTTIGESFEREFPPVTAKEVRLDIGDATEGPTIWEIALIDAK